VIGKDEQSAFRTRFNVCHELGHLVLHKNVSPPEFADKNHFKVIEAQADRFAAAFLTPATTFSQEIRKPSLDGFRALKPRWKTSIKQMIHRAQDLDIISREEARSLYINYNRRRWNTQEPLDDTENIEEPRLVRRVFEAVIENSIIDRSQITAALPFNPDEVEELASLPHGYLDEESAYSWAIRHLESGFK
jgi:Zn-dependent peptidase ImmA (M78 family)